jgi:hypothetical protein
MNNENSEYKDLARKYKEKLNKEMEKEFTNTKKGISREYQLFRKDSMPKHLTIYEKLCNISEKILHLKLKEENREKIQTNINICHLDITAEGATAFSFIFPAIFLLTGVLISLLTGSLFLVLFFLCAGLGLIYFTGKIPEYFANIWRMKASNQMVLSIFYIVTYMRHTSNLEKAIEFAAEHLSPPLSLDFKKILWNVQTGVFDNVKDSVEEYLNGWRKWNLEFVESFHLIEGSLYETSEERRLSLLDKSLDVILEETYEKMLHYAQNLKGPITALHMLGIIMPILGLVILPLVVSFMEGISWWHLAILYNIIIPILIYFFGKSILSKRPTGYGETDITETDPQLKKYKNIVIKIGKKEIFITPIFLCIFIFSILFLIALIPLIIHFLYPYFDMTLPFGFEFLDYKTSSTNPNIIIGPFGIGATILSFFFPLALAFSLGIYFKIRSKNVHKIREEGKKLEDEFSTALFQLGNRLGDGIPAETAFKKVADVMPETQSGKFFKIVANNISKLGTGVQAAIFDPKIGAIISFPSKMINSTMKVLIQSVKKGPIIAAQAILNIARYIKEIHKVNERLKDLMTDVISDMKNQINFLTPVIAGIVVGITSMITFILGKLGGSINQLGATEVGTQIGTLAGMFGDGIPTYYFQIVVGIYVFQIIYILTILSNGIENGTDKLQERYLLGKNLIKGTTLYVIIAITITIIFNIIASRIVEVTAVIG